MDWTFWLLIVTALLNSIASVLAWAAKLRWSKEFSDAKDERLKARDDKIATLQQHIDNLKELSPINLKDHIAGITEIQEKRVSTLKTQLEATTAELQELQSKIQQGDHRDKTEAKDAISGLEEERKNLENRISKLQSQIEQVQTAQEALKDQAGLVPTISYVRELNLVDTEGRVRAMLTTLIDNAPNLFFYDKEGYKPGREGDFLIALGLGDDDASLTFRSKQRGTRAELYVDDDGRVSMKFDSRGNHNQNTMSLSLFEGDASFSIYTQKPHSQISIKLREDGTPWLFVTKDGEEIWHMP